MPVLAEQGMASVASMPMTSSISALALSGSACGQVHLVEHGHHFHAQVQGGVAVGHGLGLDALAGVDHQQRAFAGRQRAADFVGEVNVTRGVNQVEVVDLAVTGLVLTAQLSAP
jgi:hypothetical protein